MISKLYRRCADYSKNYFDFKNTKTFFEHENEDYIINLVFDAKPLYKSLYIFFETEFNVLINYLLKNLILSRIQELMSLANVLILFVFKKNNNYRLCVDYKELNAFIIKNKYLFLLIDETLNRFVSVAYFIKLDFKNVYY